MSRPKTMFERAEDAYVAGDVRAYVTLPRAPHCDNLVLHPRGACRFCDDAEELQAEREVLDVSNTGVNNRKYPCPAAMRRNLGNINKWAGNVPQPLGQNIQTPLGEIPDTEYETP